MKNYKNTTISVLSLKAKICGMQYISRRIQTQINRSIGKDRYVLKEKKKLFGQSTRHLLAAYALLRGKPFSAVEKKCQIGNYLNPELILTIIKEHAPYAYVTYKLSSGQTIRSKWTIEAVKDLLIREVV